jgi:hypothetical protein
MQTLPLIFRLFYSHNSTFETHVHCSRRNMKQKKTVDADITNNVLSARVSLVSAVWLTHKSSVPCKLRKLISQICIHSNILKFIYRQVIMYSDTNKMINVSLHMTPCRFVNSDSCVAGCFLHSVCRWRNWASLESQ